MHRGVGSGSRMILCVVTGCGGGDWPPLLALAKGLHGAGHDLVVVCDSITVKSVKAAGLPPLCLPGNLDFGNYLYPVLSRLLEGEEKIKARSVNPLLFWGESCIEYIVRSLGDWRPCLVMTSLFGLGLGELLAKYFSVPRCFLNPSFYFEYPDHSFRACDFSPVGAQMYRHWLRPLSLSADLVLNATDFLFDCSPGQLPVNHFYVGPMFWEDQGGRLDYISEPGPPWVLVTLSTSPQAGDTAIVKTAVEALEDSCVRVLVTLSPGHGREEFGAVPGNVHITGYIPHSHVLPSTLLVISHAGHGTVMKAMYHGVPMVLVPWGRDQPGVALRAERLGTAVVLSRENCTVAALSQAMNTVMNNSEYTQSALQQSSRFREADGVADALWAIEQFWTNG